MDAVRFIQELAVILVLAGITGWICQRIGLSGVVGYLVAGIVVAHTWPVSLLMNEGRIEAAAQVGLVFLIFGIGLRLSIHKLRRLGGSLVLATAGGAIGVYYLSRVMGAALGWSATEGLFLAAMLMTSSSAIISKVLQEAGITHERSSQMAMAITVMEDVVAVVMLTLLGSLVQFSGPASMSMSRTLGVMGAFVALVVIGGLMLFPRLLRRMSIMADLELQTLGITGLLFAMAVVAYHAGYSLALGAFLLGTIVAETPHVTQVERTFEGMKDVFSAVFFVAIGMQIDPRQLLDSIGLIAGISVFALCARVTSVSAALMLTGKRPKDALRTGLTVTPIGEFAFIIVQAGIAAAVLPARFYPLAVGVCLLTTLAASLLSRYSEQVATALLRGTPSGLETWLGHYHRWLEQLALRQQRHPLWRISRKRFVQIGLEALVVSGLLLFSRQLLAAVVKWLGPDRRFPVGPEIIFWSVLAVLVLAPLVAIWRNISALALLYAQEATAGRNHNARLTAFVYGSIRVVAGMFMFLWLSAMLPSAGATRWVLLATAPLAALAMIFLRRKLVYWHSHLEVGLQDIVEAPDDTMAADHTPWLHPHNNWNLQVLECTLPYLADNQGRTIADLALRSKYGCTVVGIERQGFMISLPGPQEVMYPLDKVLLLGTSEQVKAGQTVIEAVSGARETEAKFDEVQMESLMLPRGSQAVDRKLADLALARHHGVQIAGIKRGGNRMLNPGGQERLRSGDELLALGTPEQIRRFKAWLADREPVAGASG